MKIKTLIKFTANISSTLDLNQVIGLVSGLIGGTSNLDLFKITQ